MHQVTRFREESARFQGEALKHEETAATAVLRRDATQAELSELQVRIAKPGR